MGGSRLIGRCLALVVAVVLALAAPAGADHDVTVPNWPTVLPPSQNAAGTVSLGFDLCRSGRASCTRKVVRRMTRRWQSLDRGCDHRAVFALTYLRTTEEFVRTIKADPGFVGDVPWINHEDVIFAELYFRAFDGWARGAAVPGAWRVAFEAAGSPDLTALGDLLLGMNAHIQRDLPYTLAHVGLVRPDGATRKADHDQVNAFLDRVVDPVQDELARRYDEIFAQSDLKPSPADELIALQVVRGWRELAWRNAERLVNARTAAERQLVRDSVEAYSEAAAEGIVATNTIPGYGATRDAHCRAAER